MNIDNEMEFLEEKSALFNFLFLKKSNLQKYQHFQNFIDTILSWLIFDFYIIDAFIMAFRNMNWK